VYVSGKVITGHHCHNYKKIVLLLMTQSMAFISMVRIICGLLLLLLLLLVVVAAAAAAACEAQSHIRECSLVGFELQVMNLILAVTGVTGFNLHFSL